MRDPLQSPIASNRATPAQGLRATFTRDHERLEKLYLDLLAAFEANDREGVAALWTEFDKGLTAHMAAEEAHLFPRFSRDHADAAAALRAEHASFRSRLAELAVWVDLHLVKDDQARAFIDELRAHAKAEDALMYPWAEGALSESERGDLVAKLEDTAHQVRRRLGLKAVKKSV